MTRCAIVSVATGAWYPAGQQRLFDSLEERGEGATRLFWRDAYPPTSPTHEEAPYAFKPYAFEEARHLGFDCALWLDASCWAVKPFDTIWGRLEADGWWLEPDGNYVGEWISDRALDLLRLSRDEAMTMPLIEGKCVGLDFRNPTANIFLDEWIKLADAGGFQGAWSNHANDVSPDPRCKGHRHDIACGSPLVARLGMSMQTEKAVWLPGAGEVPDHVCVLAQGM